MIVKHACYQLYQCFFLYFNVMNPLQQEVCHIAEPLPEGKETVKAVYAFR